MSLTYCFEFPYIKQALVKCKRSDLAVVDTDGCEALVKSAVNRGVYVYGYLNIGALEDGRSYYQKFKSLRLAYYDGWDGEYWIDVTDKIWQAHIIDEAEKIKACGAIGLYLDNTDIYYMCARPSWLKNPLRKVPDATAVYHALESIVLALHNMSLIVMPNGGDAFVTDKQKKISQAKIIIQRLLGRTRI